MLKEGREGAETRFPRGLDMHKLWLYLLMEIHRIAGENIE